MFFMIFDSCFRCFLHFMISPKYIFKSCNSSVLSLSQFCHCILRFSCIPFAVGRRQCLGEQFARSRYFMYMATLLRKWKFVGSPGKFGSCDPRNSAYIDNKSTYRAKSFFCKAVKRQ
jgi:hypothetical protein